jgi:hypothetical protein
MEIPTISILDPKALPPWGGLYLGAVRLLKQVTFPPHWLRVLDDETRRQHFERWLAHTLRLINRHLWPSYDPKQCRWMGESVGFMHDLTEADLLLMLHIQHPASGGTEFDKNPESPLRSLSTSTHRDWFRQEDGSGIFDSSSYYLGVADDQVKAFANLCWASDDNKQTPVSYRVKRRLQRPRAMQMALRWRLLQFEWEEATTSLTPSMCSGHCLQGLLGVGAVIERLIQDGHLDDMGAALSRWAVDIGDRRVMAGVHYPSDSLCSWVIFLRMAEFIFERHEVKEMLAFAIKESYVYGQITRFAATKEGAVYMEPLSLLGDSFADCPIPDRVDSIDID